MARTPRPSGRHPAEHAGHQCRHPRRAPGGGRRANKTVSKAEAIKKFAVLDTDFTIETGELTPTLKLKRNVIHDSYKEGHRRPVHVDPIDATEPSGPRGSEGLSRSPNRPGCYRCRSVDAMSAQHGDPADSAI